MQATVAYYLLLDNKLRTTSGYLGAEYQESMVCWEFFSHSQYGAPGFGLRHHFAAERKWALGLQVILV